MSPDHHAVTRLLVAWQEGDEDAFARLSEVVYAELRRVAARRLGGERRNHTLQPTELVNETFLRLLKADVAWQDRVHFFAVAARAMRRVLLDHARARDRAKRGSGALRMTLGDQHASTPAPSADIVALDQALDALAALDGDQARIVELYYFAGLTLEEIAAVVERPRSTVHRLLRSAQAWLHHRLAPTSGAPSAGVPSAAASTAGAPNA